MKQGQWYRRISLRSQLLAAAALGILTVFAIPGYMSVSTARRVSNIVFTERLRQARAASNSIDALITHTKYQLSSVAVTEGFLDKEKLKDRLASLSNLVHTMGTYDSLWLVDREGKLLWASSPGQELLLDRVTQRPFFTQALTGEVTTVGQIDIEEFSHPPVAVVVAPVINRENEVYAALVGSLHLSHMGINLASLPKGERGFISTLIDRRGIVLATSEGIDSAFPYSDPHLELLRGFIEQRQPGVALHQEQAGGHVVVYAPLTAMEGGVVTEERQDMALGIVSSLRNTYIFMGVVVLLLTSLGAWLLVQHITRPLEVLGAAATGIAAGNLEEPIRTARQDEIGQLARSFETMRRKLRASQEERERWERDLEDRVRQRTEEVQRLLGHVISAQEEERKRLARELHDEMAQTLATLLLGISSLQGALPPEQTRQREMLGRFLAQGEQALRDIRRMILDLRPSYLDDMGLVAALRSYANDRLGPAGARVSFEARGEERRLSSAVETAIYRIMQEAVTNVAKHSRATGARILLDFSPRLFVGEVEDDGVGFDPEAKYSSDGGSVGLQGMKERAALVGARLLVKSMPGQGSVVRVEMPLAEDGDRG
ncbi:MAG: HAMP domain-containing protein [Chloroflexi bacterium]|nr:HAMP domain-containing protein [Chloroflexota bacterium]